jgi:hypothetical protein
MNIEIDQSGKIENTSVNTIVAFSNSEFACVLLSAKDKRAIQKIFRQINKPRMYIYKVFCLVDFYFDKKIFIQDQYDNYR